ncbi:putative Methionyl aminopeptidase [Rhodotorula taiwanensis]|uniref:Methionine aminopeptidase n=1 Tax=Rhodotorula taiwanensis TaxID=741276 RepID=A0A2S5BIW1_9BASI|nr:putative Methionyl aminopeptidase [Rhodotorula taiwanensis]
MLRNDELVQSPPALPVASSLARRAPSHPLLQLVLLTPAIDKVARIEHAILTSAPAQTLLRYRLASERAVVALVGLASLGAVVRWRRQWRAIVYALAVGDVVKRTVDLLVNLGETGEVSRKQRRQSQQDRERDNDDARQETQHVLSFWLLVALLSLAESFRTTPRHPLVVSPSASVSARLAATLRRVRHAYLQFLRRYILPTLLRTRWAAQRFVSTYPSFDPAPVLAKLPTVPGHYYLRLPFTTPRARPRPAASFPQPSAHASDRPPRGTGPMPLAWAWFLASSSSTTTPASSSNTTAAEIRWTLLKLIVLLMGQRTDALGARNVLWTWGIEPLVAATSRLRGLSDSSPFAEDGDEQDKWVVKLVRESRRKRSPRIAPVTKAADVPIRIVDPSHEADDADETGDESRQIDELSGVSPYAWTPRLARVVRPASAPGSSPALFDQPRPRSPSSTSATPRRPLSRSHDHHASVTPSSRSSSTGSSTHSQSRSYSSANRSNSASPSPYQLQSPPFLPTPIRNASGGNHANAAPKGGTSRSTPAGVTYRFASANHPLLGPRSSSSASSGGSATATALTQAALNSLRLRSGDLVHNHREDSFAEEEEEDDDDDDDGLLTPGEEEAEEGQRKTSPATRLAAAAMVPRTLESKLSGTSRTERPTPSGPGARLCTGGCSKPAGPLECPKCQGLGVAGSFFCGQLCFARNYPAHHKKLHVTSTRSSYVFPPGTKDGFDGKYRYTGKLRAVMPLEEVPKRVVPDHIPKPDYATEANGVSFGEQVAFINERQGRTCSPEEIVKMRKVCKLGREVLDIAASHIKPGITTLELDRIVHEECVKRDAYPSPLGYHKFPRSVCTSVNEVICHGIPDARPLENGDIINLDVSLFHDGYHSDLNATYPVGDAVPQENLDLIACSRKCLDEAIRACRPGTPFQDLGNIIEDVATKAGFTTNKTFVGHGIHTLFHPPGPNVPHYAGNKQPGVMKVGHTFTIEPMICAGREKDIHWPDSASAQPLWTAATVDGKASAQFEETLLITETGVEVLTAAPGWSLPPSDGSPNASSSTSSSKKKKKRKTAAQKAAAEEEAPTSGGFAAEGSNPTEK